MEKPKYIYVSGPYTKGDVAENVRKAIAVAETLIRNGYVPYLPHITHLWHLCSPHSWEYWLELDLAWIEKCDGVLRMEGESKGADLEVARAKELGKPIFPNVVMVESYYKNWEK